jgi:FMN reductase
MDMQDRRTRIVGFGGTLRGGSRSLIALEKALEGAKRAGASTELVSLNDLRLPLFRPGEPLSSYPGDAAAWIEAARRADGMIWSTGAYHGTIAGATKNALDYLEFLAQDGYLDRVPVGLIAASGGSMAGVTAIDSMVHTVHALRGTVIPLKVPVPQARKAIRASGEFHERDIEQRLLKLGSLVVETARALRMSPEGALAA